MHLFNFLFQKKTSNVFLRLWSKILGKRSSHDSSKKSIQTRLSGSEATKPLKNTNNNSNPIQSSVAFLSSQGYRHFKKNELSKATYYFREVLKIQPSNQYGLVGLGDIYRKKYRLQDAIYYYEQCLLKYPKNTFALFGLAESFRLQNLFHRSLEVWDQYLKITDKNVNVLLRVAEVCQKVKEIDRAEECYLQILEIDPQNIQAHTGLGRHYYVTNDFKKALDFLNPLYIKQGSNNTNIRVLTSIGNCYRRLKVFDKGTGYFEEALAIEETNYYALFGLADCYRGLRYLDKSLVYWNRILAEHPNNKTILTRVADAYRQQEQFDLAESYYERALGITYDFYAILGLAAIYVIRKRYEEAALKLEELLSHHPTSNRIYPVLMECYIFLADYESAKFLFNTFSGLANIQADICLRMNELWSLLEENTNKN